MHLMKIDSGFVRIANPIIATSLQQIMAKHQGVKFLNTGPPLRLPNPTALTITSPGINRGILEYMANLQNVTVLLVQSI